MTKFKTVWFWDSGFIMENGTKHVMSFYDESHEKPSLVKNEKSPNHAYCHSFNSVDKKGHTVVSLVSDDFQETMPLWYVLLVDESSFPRMKTLLAFSGDLFSEGTVISFEEAIEIGISPSDSCGFVRWFSTDSRVQQIYVNEHFRRKRISTKLFAVADLLTACEEPWSGVFIHGGDITSDDGEKLRQSWHGSTRLDSRVGEFKPQ